MQLGGGQASEVLIRMREESGHGLEAVQVTGHCGSSPLPPAPSRLRPLCLERTASQPLA